MMTTGDKPIIDFTLKFEHDVICDESDEYTYVYIQLFAMEEGGTNPFKTFDRSFESEADNILLTVCKGSFLRGMRKQYP